MIERIRALVEFCHINLCDPASFPLPLLPWSYSLGSGLDVIFCQNVLIYFARERRVEIVRRLCQHLRLGGYLLLGPAEVIGLHLPGVQPIRLTDALVYQRIAPRDLQGTVSSLA